ncbi:MAG TPA: hypothetical protein VGC59_11935 [Solirubrobacteraceae bacterium]|jgi:hypothetical protein
MTLSLLLFVLMVSSLAALVVTLVVDAVRARRRESLPRRTAGPVPRHGRGLKHDRGDCPQPRRPAPSTSARARRDGTRSSCPR